jgi:hypothetical protein
VFAYKLFCYGLGTLVLAFVGVQLWFLVQVLYWGHYQSPTSAFMDQRLEALRARNPKASSGISGFRTTHLRAPQARRRRRRRREVSRPRGFDWEAIVQARAKNESRGRIVAGASTISQQLAKNLFLSSERSWLRKGEEALITWMIEATMSEAPHPGAVSQLRRMGRGGVRRRGRRAPPLRRAGERADARAGRVARGRSFPVRAATSADAPRRTSKGASAPFFFAQASAQIP